MNTDHIVAGQPVALNCTHCGSTQWTTEGASLDRVIDAVRGFLLMHRRCEKPIEPSKQVELFNGLGQTQNEAIAESHRHIDASTDDPLEFLDGFRIDGSTDEPAPEIDPPSPYAKFEQMYPLADCVIELRAQLKEALTPKQFERCLSWVIPDQDTGIFNAVANWARIERAHLDAGQRAPIPGLTIPRREPMPEKLAELLGAKPKEKRGARPLTSPPKKRRQKP